MKMSSFGLSCGLIAMLASTGCATRKFGTGSNSGTVESAGSNTAIEYADPLLEEFDRNPVAAMNKIPQKFGVTGKPLNDAKLAGLTPAKRDSVRGNFCKVGTDGNRVCLNQVEPGRAAIVLGNDDAAQLVDNGAKMLRTLEEMDAARLTQAILPEQPWSSDYWAIARGILGIRYNDPAFEIEKSDYLTLKNMTAKEPAQAIVASGNAEKIDNLSPSEKYDLLMGDGTWALTKKMWSEGQGYWDQNPDKKPEEKVETWMGICHGWAPAAYMMPRPFKTVKIKTDAGVELNFYPSDLKGLGSLLWANASPRAKFIGGRCNIEDSKVTKDKKTGRILDQACFDTNPGSWHMAVVNQIGVSKRSMVMDATFDYQVWNQPISAYKYTYFNPQTKKKASTLAEATVTKEEYTSDKFAQIRKNNSARKFVGVIMDVTYVVETQPDHSPDDSPNYDATKVARYAYDLEIDASGKIIGGEWYQNAHPDFLWTIDQSLEAASAGEARLNDNWTVGSPMPASYKALAPRASASGIPLNKVLKALFSAAQK